MSNLIDMTGERFGRLTVMEFAFIDIYRHAHWLCKCDCGNEKIINGKALRCGDTKSCGCINLERIKTMGIKHNCRKTRLYKTWANMKSRCQNPNATNYSNYGGRGIQVCDEWKNSFENFRDWALSNGYKDDLTIDRIDVNGNYKPSNCRWATNKQQGNNKSDNREITYNGRTKTLMQWSEITGIKRETIAKRLNSGWPVEKALTELIKNKNIGVIA